MQRGTQKLQRTVVAPPPSPSSEKLPSNRVLEVVLGPDEDVEWEWTCTAEGISYVSGYRIVPRVSKNSAPDAGAASCGNAS